MMLSGENSSVKKKRLSKLLENLITTGRDEKIRTSDHLTPSQVRYQTALHPDPIYVNFVKIFFISINSDFISAKKPAESLCVFVFDLLPFAKTFFAPTMVKPSS